MEMEGHIIKLKENFSNLIDCINNLPCENIDEVLKNADINLYISSLLNSSIIRKSTWKLSDYVDDLQKYMCENFSCCCEEDIEIMRDEDMITISYCYLDSVIMAYIKTDKGWHLDFIRSCGASGRWPDQYYDLTNKSILDLSNRRLKNLKIDYHNDYYSLFDEIQSLVQFF